MCLHLPLLLIAAIATALSIAEPVDVGGDLLDASGAGPLCPTDVLAGTEARTTSVLEEQSLGRPQGLLSSRSSQHDSAGGGIMRVIVSLAGVLGLIFLLRGVMLRHGGVGVGQTAGGSDVLEVLARRSIARGQALILLRLDRRLLLLHENTTAKSMTALSEITDPEEAAAIVARFETETHTQAGAEVVDLTRRPGSTFARLFPRMGGDAP